jgi:hypothetical protein
MTTSFGDDRPPAAAADAGEAGIGGDGAQVFARRGVTQYEGQTLPV